ncbi:hypothetical protein THRCLA_01752 [Thraustotheca clavata]|uniref:Uncharacterized protein n=1 Tax=Thraustotheca clavata TaxID=74557 RepID=A0A1W0A7H5_9STRA|nr:hypothetical protein THRCLA_01752 [Thraustotheca clavata]
MALSDLEMDDLFFGDDINEDEDEEDEEEGMEYMIDPKLFEKYVAKGRGKQEKRENEESKTEDESSTDNEEQQSAMEQIDNAIPIKQREMNNAMPMRSHSMPNKSSGYLDEQKWRMKYLNRLKIAKDGEEQSIPRHEKRSPVKTEPRRLRAMSVAHASNPIEIPLHPTASPTIRLSSVPLPMQAHFRRTEDNMSEPFYRHSRHVDNMETNDSEFIPPHQMIERGCFSLGMKHHFKHKPGNI